MDQATRLALAGVSVAVLFPLLDGCSGQLLCLAGQCYGTPETEEVRAKRAAYVEELRKRAAEDNRKEAERRAEEWRAYQGRLQAQEAARKESEDNRRADDLSYDWLAVKQKEVLREWVWQTRSCMRDAVEAQLMAGVRDSERIVDWLMRPCGEHLQNVLTQGLGIPIDVAISLLRAMAYDSLSRIPGLSRKMPQATAPKQADDSGLNSVDMKLSACLITKVPYGRYSSLDDGKSAQILLKDKCPKDWSAWVRVCVNAGETRDNCVRKSVVIAQAAIRLLGK